MGYNGNLSIEERFWLKVDKRGPEECWNWIGALDTLGRGMITINNKHNGAPRISYYLNYSIEPGKLCVLHKCDNPACVNPNHLYLGTMKDNAQDRKNRNRAFYGKGDQSRYHKLSQSAANEIRKLYKPKIFGSQKIANIYGVSKKCILNIIHNRTWLDVITPDS